MREPKVQLPWDLQPTCFVLSRKRSFSTFALPPPVQQSTRGDGALGPKSIPEYAKKRLRLAVMISTGDAARWEALRKLRQLVLLDPHASRLGTTLAAEASLFKDEGRLVQSFQDAFAPKATATLVKRSASLVRFAEWFFGQRGSVGSPVAASERCLYDYVVHLRSSASPSSASSFVEAWRFLHHHVGVIGAPLDCNVSQRVRGVCKSMLQEKGPLRQAAPLTVKMVKGLEQLVTIAPYKHWRVIAGHLLFCLGSCSRFSDSMYLENLDGSEHDGITLLEARSSKFKTRRGTELLPLCSLGSFFYDTPWGLEWIAQRQAQGLGLRPSLPAFSEIDQTWLERPMSTGECTLYLKELLASSGFLGSELDELTSHSLKTTVLSWAAKSGQVSLADRRLLGHHVDSSVKSPLTYARDESARLMLRVHSLVKEIRGGRFRPDASRVWRLAMMIRAEAGEGLVEVEQSEPPMVAESDSDEDDFDHQDMQAMSGCMARPEPPTAAEAALMGDCRMHVFSRVVHVLNGRKFHCGRLVSRNFGPVDANVALCDLPMCAQCAASRSR